MERHRCKVCLKRFSNGRALGGHMRSHMVNAAPPHGHDLMMSEVHHGGGDSAPLLWSPSSSEGDDDDEDEKGLCYGLRENPQRSIRIVDPEFSFSASVVVQDRESETESSKNPTRRRSKRRRMSTAPKPDYNNSNNYVHNYKKDPKEKESWTEAEAVSSISGSTTEEDVAFWLMMLSRDKWTATTGRRQVEEEVEEEEESDDESDSEEAGLKLSKNRNKRGSYECETCNKVFGSYQALGGHRASHKKIKVLDQRMNATTTSAISTQMKKIHECPVCFRVFASGQALGGHKRSHVAGFSTPLKIAPTRQSFIDLNLPPAPFDEDDLSSALSDADFVNNQLI